MRNVLKTRIKNWFTTALGALALMGTFLTYFGVFGGNLDATEFTVGVVVSLALFWSKDDFFFPLRSAITKSSTHEDEGLGGNGNGLPNTKK